MRVEVPVLFRAITSMWYNQKHSKILIKQLSSEGSNIFSFGPVIKIFLGVE